MKSTHGDEMEIVRASHLIESRSDRSVNVRDSSDSCNRTIRSVSAVVEDTTRLTEEGRDPELPQRDSEMRRQKIQRPMRRQRRDPVQ